MAKYVEAGATTSFFNCFVGIDKFLSPVSPQPNFEITDDTNSASDFPTNELDVETDADGFLQEATFDGDESMESHQASERIPQKESRPLVTFDREKPNAKKPFQLKGRLRQNGVSRFKPLKINDSRHFSF